MTNGEVVNELVRAFDVLNFSSHMDYRRKEAFNMAKNALETLSAIEFIINREDSLIGRAQEDVIRYQMICKVMQTWKAGEEE